MQTGDQNVLWRKHADWHDQTKFSFAQKVDMNGKYKLVLFTGGYQIIIGK